MLPFFFVFASQADQYSVCVSFNSSSSTTVSSANSNSPSVFPRDEYRFTPGGGDHSNLTSRLVSLNGDPPLQVDSSLTPHHVTSASAVSSGVISGAVKIGANAGQSQCAGGASDTIVLDGHSYGFIVLLGANADVCQ
jgi:hypothetical protein